MEGGGLDQGQKHLVAYGLLFGKELVQEHRAHVGLQIDGRPLIGEGHHPRRCGRTDAGQRQQPLVGLRKPTGPLGGAPVGRALERQGATVVTEALPQLEHIGHSGGRQGIHRGKRRQEPLPEAADARHLGLLKHDLRDEHRVGVVHVAPGQVAVQLVAAGEHRGHEVIERDALLVHLRTLGYPTKSFKSPKEAEKSETTRRSSSAYSAESSGW